LQTGFASKDLPIGILNPAPYAFFLGQIEGVLQMRQACDPTRPYDLARPERLGHAGLFGHTLYRLDSHVRAVGPVKDKRGIWGEKICCPDWLIRIGHDDPARSRPCKVPYCGAIPPACIPAYAIHLGHSTRLSFSFEMLVVAMHSDNPGGRNRLFRYVHSARRETRKKTGDQSCMSIPTWS
jgi:hypothetical protein